MKLYHLDRTGTLVDGQRIELQPLEKLSEEVRNSYFVKEFSEGVSQHGLRYLNTSVPIHSAIGNLSGDPVILASKFEDAKSDLDCKIIELVAELVRRCYFPELPSRMTSLFAVEKISNFDQWPELRNAQRANIFELDTSKNTPRFDANFLKGGSVFGASGLSWHLGFHTSAAFDFAYKYWSGNVSDSPRFEYLVQLPTDPIHKLKL